MYVGCTTLRREAGVMFGFCWGCDSLFNYYLPYSYTVLKSETVKETVVTIIFDKKKIMGK